MKKAISVLLVLVMALSLCACGAKSKYVGTYTCDVTQSTRHTNIFSTVEMNLRADGTGTWEKTASKFLMCEDLYGKNLYVGDVLEFGQLTWNVEGDYLSIVGTITYYYGYDEGIVPFSEERTDTIFASYELKGNQLVEISEYPHNFTKVK